ncbi:MAG: PAS-domain containing protein [Rhodospirillaceae bacterium]|nr:PAS-domain containing protein [Rhodospirillaceae bacterium]
MTRHHRPGRNASVVAASVGFALAPMSAAFAQGSIPSDGATSGILGIGLAIALAVAALAAFKARQWHKASDALRSALEGESFARQAAEATLASEKAIWSTAPVGHVAWLAGNPIAADDKARNALQLTEAALMPVDLAGRAHADDRQALQDALRDLDRDGHAFVLLPRPAEGMPRMRWIGRVGADGRRHLWLSEVDDILAPIEQASQHAMATAASLGQLLDQLPYPVWRRGTDLAIAWCNLAFANIYDMPVERIIGERREINAAAKALAQRAQRVGLAQSESQQLVVKGQRRLYDLTEVPLPDGSVIGFALDQTQLEESHAELTRHLAAHDDVLQALSTGIVIFGPDRRVKFFNSAFRELFTLDAHFLRQEPNVDQVLDKLRERRQIPEQADFRSFKKEWSRHVMSVIEPFEDLMHVPSGATYRMMAAPHPFGGVILTFEDVTDNLTLERNYNTLIEVQKETIDHLYEGIAVFGSDGRLKLHNPAFERLWNLPADSLEGEPHVTQIADAVKPFFEGRPNWLDLRHRIITEVAERELKNIRLERVDGKIVDIAAIPLADGGRLFKYTDVTDSINMERALTERNEALMAADRLKSEFIANVSYEFRTPLNAIIGYAELLARQYFGDMNERQLEYASAILDSAQNLILMIGDVIDVAAIEAGYIQLEPVAVDIRQLVESISRLFQQRARSRNIDLVLEVPADIGTLQADPQRLKQALGNLLSAAIGAAPGGRTVVVSVRRHVENLEVCVAVRGAPDDFGLDVGPDSDSAQARSSTRGLGVALARTLIELHGGSLQTESGAMGRRIVCLLPITAA